MKKPFPKKLFKIFLQVVLLVFAFSSCKQIIGTNDEGQIEYDISYPDSISNDIMSSMLPSKMITKFKNNQISSEFRVGMGIISATFIANGEDKTMASLFKVVDKKYALLYNKEKTQEELEKLPKFEVTELKETKKIAGYNCQKALVTQVDNPKNSFNVYYTQEIKVKNPNWNLPYKQIPGVLLEYQIRHKDMEMRFKARKVIIEKINEEDFSLNPEYQVVQHDQLPEIIQSFF